MAPVNYPQINGNRYSWSSIELRVLGKRILGVKSVDFAQALEPGEVYGTHAQKIGRTRGELKPTGSIEMNKEEAEDLVNTLGDGYMEVPFDVVIAFRELTTISTAIIHGARIKNMDSSHSQGTDALMMKLELDVMWIEINGKKPLFNMLSPNI